MLEEEAPIRLTVTFEAAPSEERVNGPSVVTFVLEPSGGVVRLTVTHENLPDMQMLDAGVASAEAVDDDLWSAIGDPIRQQMIDLLLSAGAGTATSLSERLPVTRQAIAKHLQVLDRVGLVHGTTTGRERRYRVDQAQLARAVAQLAAVGASWGTRLQRIKQVAETIQLDSDI